MKTGRTLQELAAEIERQRELRRDFLADTRHLSLGADGRLTIQGVDDTPTFKVSPLAHGQIAQRLDIPKRFYDRLFDKHADLLANTVNQLFRREPERRMVRTLDGRARAFLSDRYRPLDHDAVVEAVFPVLAQLEVEVLSCEVTERRLYVKFATPRLEQEVLPGDVIRAGGVISNSEVGLGALRIDDLDYRLVCANGMIREVVSRSSHVGRTNGFEGLEASEFFRDETREADDRALMLKLRDALRGMFTRERFEQRLTQYRAATEDRIDKPLEVVELLRRRLTLTEEQRDSVLTHLLRGGDLTRWGLANAVTRVSQDTSDYDEATELEKLGGRVIELPPTEWQTLTAAA